MKLDYNIIKMVESSYSTSDSQLRAYLKIRREKYWVKRFVVLGNGMLHYYMKPTSLKPRVILLLANTTVKDLGKQKNEYILEILKGSNFRLLISFVNERDHKAWFEVLKGSSTIENGQTPGETKYSPIQQSKMMREETQRLISSIPMIPIQSMLQQR